VCVTSDGRLAITASSDQSIKVWDLRTYSVLATFTAEEWFTTCAISEDGSTVVAGEYYGRIHFFTLLGLDGTDDGAEVVPPY